MANDPSIAYREQLLNRQRAFDRKYRRLFNIAAYGVAELIKDPSIRLTTGFLMFPDAIKIRVTDIVKEFHDKTLALTKGDIVESWMLSNKKNDAVVRQYFSIMSGITAQQKAPFFMTNLPALNSFMNRKHRTETLSKTVWNTSKQFRSELEMHLGLGIMNGDSSPTIAKRIQKYLTNPEDLFRRIRDKNGRLVASRRMRATKRGRGVYKSAYKNALRTARSETNRAYLLADDIRWSQMTMVEGVVISLSAQHPNYNYIEICEELAGIYPKSFSFGGWHTCCLCHKTPLLSDERNFEAYLQGTADLKANPVTEYPVSFKNHLRQNYEKYGAYSTKPYWIQDNAGVVNNLLIT